MSDLQNIIKKKFGHRLRTRVSGICIKDEKILMVRHAGLGKTGTFWAPPGGGMDFGMNAKKNLIREVKEETGLDVTVGSFMFVHEYLGNPLHAIELFFRIIIEDGEIKRGFDPELSSNNQIIKEVKFMSFKEIVDLGGAQTHNIFSVCKSISEIEFLNGYLIFQ